MGTEGKLEKTQTGQTVREDVESVGRPDPFRRSERPAWRQRWLPTDHYHHTRLCFNQRKLKEATS